MKNITNIIQIIKMVAKYGAYIIVIVDGLNFIASGFENIDNPKQIDND